jgi:hypothetical protein
VWEHDWQLIASALALNIQEVGGFLSATLIDLSGAPELRAASAVLAIAIDRPQAYQRCVGLSEPAPLKKRITFEWFYKNILDNTIL